MSAAVMLSPSRINNRSLIIGLIFMVGCVVAAFSLKPHKFWADQIGNPNYEQVIPRAFGDWVEKPETTNSVVDPIQADKIAHIYTSTLARVYIHKPTGRQLMLSIAYGRNQDLDTQLHVPEMCYASQGYKIDNNTPHDVATRFGTLPAVRLQTTYASYHEPLTYFIRVGDRVVRGSRDRNLTRIRMALRGFLVDGMLFRVSENTFDPHAHELQDKFINDLLDSLAPTAREKIMGSPPPAAK